MKKRTFPSAATTLANPSGAASVGSAANPGRGTGSGRTSQAIVPSGVAGGMGVKGFTSVTGRAKRTAAVAAPAAPDVAEALASTGTAVGGISHGASHGTSRNASTTSIRPASSAPRQRAVLGQLSDMDLRLLQVFKSVAECGGMSAAELELNIGTSTVSRHMKDLETRLGLTLCRRGRAGFALTAEGQRVYDETLRLLSAVDAFRSSIDDIHQRMGGRLEVAVFDKTASNPAAHIGAAIALFASRAPDVSLHMHVAAIPAIERGLMDGSLHVGIIPAHRVSQSLVYTHLFTETMLLYCGAKHPLFGADHSALTWDALRAHQFAGLGYHSPNMQLSHSARLPRKATGFDQESIATLVLSGRYLGFLPDHYAENFQRQGLMQAVLPAQFFYPCQFVSVLRKSPQPPRAAQAFAQCLVQAHA